MTGVSQAAGWSTHTNTDPMTDEKTVFAGAENENSRFYLYTRQNSYWKKDSDLYPRYEYIGGFVLKRRNFSQIHYEPKLITVRVDNNQPVNMFFTSWEPDKVFFDLTKERRLIDEMMKGKVMLVQYPTSRNGKKIERYSLRGSTVAMKKALIGYESTKE